MTFRIRGLCRPLLTVICAIALMASESLAAPWAFVGPRQQAMGGAGVAFTSDSTANYWNPANLAFQDGWGVALPITADANIENDALEKLSNLIVGYDELSGSAKSIIDCQPTCVGVGITPGDAQGVVDLVGQFLDYGQGGESVHVSGSLGLAGRFGSLGISILSLTSGTVFPNTDLNNIALGATALSNLVTPGCCQTPVNVALGNAIQTANPTLPAGGGGHFVFLLEQAGLDTFDPEVDSFARGLAAPGANGNFSSNSTGALTTGLSTQEFGISYALKLPVPFIDKTSGTTRNVLNLVHNKLAVSVVPKYMLGVTFVKFVQYNDGDSVGQVVSGLADFDNTRVSSAFGLDVGVAYRPTSWLQFGLMARNINSPSFDTQTVPLADGRVFNSIEIDPQVRMGLALVPVKNLILAFDFDATQNNILTLRNVQSRIVSIGGEYAIPFHRHLALALRLGTYTNVSGTVNQDWAMTGGLGLRFGSFRVDLSAGGSFEDEIIRTGSTTQDTFPSRFNAGLGISWEKDL